MCDKNVTLNIQLVTHINGVDYLCYRDELLVESVRTDTEARAVLYPSQRISCCVDVRRPETIGRQRVSQRVLSTKIDNAFKSGTINKGLTPAESD
jgi:hypothetical protein